MATPARRSGDHDPRRLDQRALHRRRGGGFGRGGGAGFEVGQKLGLGYGGTYPAVAKTVEKYEVVTVTAVGKPGTQTYLAADAKAGDTTIRVRNAGNISVGDKINLDIDSIGHGIETVTVKSIGGGGWRRRPRRRRREPRTGGPAEVQPCDQPALQRQGNGDQLPAGDGLCPLSNEPIQPLGTGITLDSPLASDHEINAVVRDAAVTTAGYQGPPAPNQWFGGPALRQRRQHGAA